MLSGAQTFTCLLYVLILGILAFPLGRVFARLNVNPENFPFRAYKFEDNGKIYDRLKIKSWKDRVPDISKVFPKIVPEKKLAAPTKSDIEKLINETCVAEFVHHFLFLCGIAIPIIWEGVLAWIIFVIYEIPGNMMFVVIQRYNRFRLMKVWRKMQ